jgi:hypothetical protein
LAWHYIVLRQYADIPPSFGQSVIYGLDLSAGECVNQNRPIVIRKRLGQRRVIVTQRRVIGVKTDKDMYPAVVP